MRRVTAGFVLWLLAGVAVAQAPAVRWARAPRGVPVEIVDRWVRADVLASGDVHLRVIRLVNDVEQTVVELTVPGPHWRSPIGEDCRAMGIAGADFARVGRRIAVRVEVAVGDLCETRAPAYATVPLPQPFP